MLSALYVISCVDEWHPCYHTNKTTHLLVLILLVTHCMYRCTLQLYICANMVLCWSLEFVTYRIQYKSIHIYQLYIKLTERFRCKKVWFKTYTYMYIVFHYFMYQGCCWFWSVCASLRTNVRVCLFVWVHPRVFENTNVNYYAGNYVCVQTHV